MQEQLGVTTIILRQWSTMLVVIEIFKLLRAGGVVDDAAEPEGEAQASDEERRSRLSHRL